MGFDTPSGGGALQDHEHTQSGDGGASIGPTDIDVGTADLVADGDFLGVGPSAALDLDTNPSTSSTSYTGANLLITTQWDQWRPAGAQTAALGALRVLDADADVRIRNLEDSETVLEETGLTAGTNHVLEPTNYVPTTTTGPVRLVLEFRSTTGSSTTLIAPQIQTGVQL